MCQRRVTGSRVANSLSAAKTPAPVKVFSSVLLPGVGVANEGDDGQAAPAPVLPIEVAVGPDVLDLLLEAVDLVSNEAAVGLQLGLAGAPGADSPAEPFQVLPLAREPGEKVLVLSKLDLEATFSGAGPGGENVEDEGGAVDNLCFEPIL